MQVPSGNQLDRALRSVSPPVPFSFIQGPAVMETRDWKCVLLNVPSTGRMKTQSLRPVKAFLVQGEVVLVPFGIEGLSGMEGWECQGHMPRGNLSCF